MQISAVNGDVLDTTVDVLILKYANGYRGADQAIALKLGTLDLKPAVGQHLFVPTYGKIAPREVLLIGVGVLRDFDYVKIASFAKQALKIIAAERPNAINVGITVHGPGYGLDELASIDSLVSGLRAGSSSKINLSIIERDPKRFSKLVEYLDGNTDRKLATQLEGFSPEAAQAISSDRTYEKRLFAAMPFKETFLDHWEFAIQPAAHANQVLIERLDHEHFLGEIISEIRTRIERASAVIAVLDENNPNVFLEVGYAWGVGKPKILLLHSQSNAPFDVSGHKLIRYNRIGELRTQLESSLRGLLQAAAI